MIDSEYEIKRCIDHLGETNPIRKVFWQMDDKVQNLIEGIRQGDDCVIIGDKLINMEGPYPLKIGMKTGLIHTCSDIVVSGGKPLYGFNAMQVDSIEQGVEVSEMVKKQADGIGCPILGGNTQLESGLKPCISFVSIGQLITKSPIFDSSAKPGNLMVIIGEPLEGEVGERIRIAKEKFATFQEIIKKIPVYAAKDASRGGWFGNLLEMMVKSQTGFKITSVPYPSFGRYMGNYLTCIDADNLDFVMEVGSKNGCPVVTVGEVTEKKEILLGKKKLLNEKKMLELIRKTPFKRPVI